MKIYQLHKYSGEYEDFSDDIVGSFLKPERAKEELRKANKEEMELRKKSDRCDACPFVDCGFLSDTDFIEYDCDEKDLYQTGYGCGCNNYQHRWDDATFEIKEVEVEE